MGFEIRTLRVEPDSQMAALFDSYAKMRTGWRGFPRTALARFIVLNPIRFGTRSPRQTLIALESAMC